MGGIPDAMCLGGMAAEEFPNAICPDGMRAGEFWMRYAG